MRYYRGKTVFRFAMSSCERGQREVKVVGRGIGLRQAFTSNKPPYKLSLVASSPTPLLYSFTTSDTLLPWACHPCSSLLLIDNTSNVSTAFSSLYNRPRTHFRPALSRQINLSTQAEPLARCHLGLSPQLNPPLAVLRFLLCRASCHEAHRQLRTHSHQTLR